MRNVSHVLVSWWEEEQTAHYYDPVLKKEGTGVIPKGCVPLEEPVITKKVVKYKISKEMVKQYGEPYEPSVS